MSPQLRRDGALALPPLVARSSGRRAQRKTQHRTSYSANQGTNHREEDSLYEVNYSVSFWVETELIPVENRFKNSEKDSK